MEYGEKTENHGKWKTHTVGPGIWGESLKNVENEKCTREDLEYGEKTENNGKWETHSVERDIWLEKLKNVENDKCPW